MKAPRLLIFAAIALITRMGAALAADGSAGSSPGAAPQTSDVTTVLNEETAIYLGLGGLNGPGKVVQLDWKAGVLGAIEMPAIARSIACWKDEVIVCVGNGRPAVFIDRDGGVGTLFSARDYVKGLMAELYQVAVHPKTGDLVFAGFSARKVRANEWNVAIIIVPAGAREKPRMIFHNANATTPPATAPDFPCIRSMAITPGGQMLLGAGVFNGPRDAVYRFPFGEDVVFDKAFMPEAGRIVADPSSDRWAALDSAAFSTAKIRLYQDAKQVRTLSTVLPSRVQSAIIAFAPDGSLIYACDVLQEAKEPAAEKQLHAIGLYSVNIDTGSFRKFAEYLHESPTRRFYETGLQALAIGRKLPWHVAESKPAGGVEEKK